MVSIDTLSSKYRYSVVKDLYMPQAENVGRFTVYMSYDAIEQLTQTAKQLGYKSSGEYARELIKRDMEARGQPIDFGLDTWGRKAEAADAPGDNPPKRNPTKKSKTD
jgi:hypothetical protein